MKLIIAGSRGISGQRAYSLIEEALKDRDFDISEVVSGGARGVDVVGERWARDHGFRIKRFTPDWSRGKHAGMLRNIQMGKYADRLLAIWDGLSPGTKAMVDFMRLYGKPVRVIEVKQVRALCSF
jgi:YspA, cpYpsA-related SLOG family